MSDEEPIAAKKMRALLQERLDEGELLFKQTIDAPMKVTIAVDGSVLIEYLFQVVVLRSMNWRGWLWFANEEVLKPLSAGSLSVATVRP